MALAAGTRLGPYEILGLIGAGGMGEVYRARDTRLDRTVAVKVLPGDLAANHERRQRFEREARTISALNHPHICTLHDVGEADGQSFLVMEHLTGETLAERLKKGPLPLEQALTVAAEIADALAAAHRQGVVHRDLKPANVMLTRSGAKLLDFGLAKLAGHGEQPAAARLASATRSTPLTSEGVIVGTLQYMAPEQLEGKSADARTDLWALGAMLYEMLTGRRAFEGTSAASLIGAILEREPAPLSTLQPLTPPSLDRLVTRCLAKQPDDRWESAHDVADELRWISQTGSASAPAPHVPHSARWRRWAVFGAMVLLAVLLGALLSSWLDWPRHPPGRAAVPAAVRTSLDARPAEELNSGGAPYSPYYRGWSHPRGGSRTALTWTPDGRTLVFVGLRGGVQQLYLRALERDEARPLAGTAGAQLPTVSPDGQWVMFWARGAIQKVAVSGGPATTIVEGVSQPPWGMTADARGQLFLGQNIGPIRQVAPDGTKTSLTTLRAGEVGHICPFLLPGARALLYTVRKRVWTWGDDEVVAQVLATGERRFLVRDAVDARYVPSGHLIFLRRGVLLGVGFDAERLEIRGNPISILEGVAQALTSNNPGKLGGAGQIAVSPTGALAWIAGPVTPYPDTVLMSVSRRGDLMPVGAPVRSYGPYVRHSPDGRRLAVVVRSPTEFGLWVHDLDRGTLTKLTTGGDIEEFEWAPDGDRMAFSVLQSGRWSLASLRADGSEPARTLATGMFSPCSWSPDGRQLATVGDANLWIARVEKGDATLRQITHGSQTERCPTFSPDGHRLAFASSGPFEVYIQPYPEPGAREQVSVDGGGHPVWNPSGRELFYLTPIDRSGKRRMMVADIPPDLGVRVGRPRPLFEYVDSDELSFACVPSPCYDVSRDGQRFFVTRTTLPPSSAPVTHVNLVINWVEELKARIPVR
jgi:serine/threonine-protein kinase